MDSNMTIALSQVSTCLSYLRSINTSREENLQEYENDNNVDMDDDEGYANPIFDSFYNKGGSCTILELTNFNVKNFNALYLSCCEILKHEICSGRGKKTSYTTKDLFFVTVAYMKSGISWDIFAKLFNMKGPTCQRLVSKTVKIVAPFFNHNFIKQTANDTSMTDLRSIEKQFANFPFCLYATDVTFQQTNRPSGNIKESKKYLSGKHKLYGYKTEVSVLPTGFAINVTPHKPGYVADINIFYQNSNFHNKKLKKLPQEDTLPDRGILCEQYPWMWGVLMDKGYVGATDYVRAIIPKKNPPHRMLPSEDERFNNLISSDRIIVENFFGRLASLWNICYSKYQLNEEIYDYIFIFCVALTNIQISKNGLREDNKYADEY